MIKKFLATLILTLALPLIVSAADRDVENLNFGWRFAYGDNDEA